MILFLIRIGLSLITMNARHVFTGPVLQLRWCTYSCHMAIIGLLNRTRDKEFINVVDSFNKNDIRVSLLISVQYLLITHRESPITMHAYYVYLHKVASGLDAHSSSYIVGDISPTFLIW